MSTRYEMIFEASGTVSQGTAEVAPQQPAPETAPETEETPA